MSANVKLNVAHTAEVINYYISIDRPRKNWDAQQASASRKVAKCQSKFLKENFLGSYIRKTNFFCVHCVGNHIPTNGKNIFKQCVWIRQVAQCQHRRDKAASIWNTKYWFLICSLLRLKYFLFIQWGHVEKVENIPLWHSPCSK